MFHRCWLNFHVQFAMFKIFLISIICRVVQNISSKKRSWREHPYVGLLTCLTSMRFNCESNVNPSFWWYSSSLNANRASLVQKNNNILGSSTFMSKFSPFCLVWPHRYSRSPLIGTFVNKDEISNENILVWCHSKFSMPFAKSKMSFNLWLGSLNLWDLNNLHRRVNL